MNNETIDIDKFLSGDSKVLEYLYEKSFNNIKRYICSAGGTEMDAEDIFQTALVQIYIKLKEEKIKIKSFEDYLFIVCRNIWRRESKKRGVTNLESDNLISEDIDRAQFFSEQKQWELYIEKFDLLGDNCKELLTLVFNKTSYEEVVEHFSYSSQTVARQRVFKCKSRLIKLITSDKRFASLNFKS